MEIRIDWDTLTGEMIVDGISDPFNDIHIDAACRLAQMPPALGRPRRTGIEIIDVDDEDRWCIRGGRLEYE